MKKRFIALALSLAVIFQCMLIFPMDSYAYDYTDNVGNRYEADQLFSYDFSADGTYTCVINKYRRLDDPNITHLTIPKEIGGVKVVGIGNNAFANAKYLEEVYIPDTINKIGDNAFYQARSLKSITIPGSVKTVGEMAFYKCISLENVTILYGVQSLGNAAFGYCIKLQTISSGRSPKLSDDQTFTSNRGFILQADSDAPIRDYADSKITKTDLPDDSPASYEYSVDENGEVTIIRYQSDRKNPIIPDQINGNPVTRLADGSFKNSDIDSIVLPDTLVTIDPNVFIGTNLTEITIPPNVTALGENFIEDKEGLVIKGSSTVVEEYVSKSKHIRFERYNPGTSSYFKLEVKINGYGSIVGTKGGYVKSGKSLNISAEPANRYQFKNWSSEGGGTFADINSSKTTFTMPSSNATLIANFEEKPKPRLVIENGVVKEYNATDDLIIPAIYEGKAVTAIDRYAFYTSSPYNHGNPTSLEIPASIVDIPDGVFRYSTNLKYIKVDSGNPNYMDKDGVLFTADGKTLLRFPAKSDLTEYTVPDGVTTINTNAFRSCSKLKKIVLPDTVTEIKYEAFEYCYALNDINIPNGVTTLGSYAFYNCYNLKSIVLPNSLKTIESSAFSSCSGLTSINIPNSVTDIGSSAFSSSGLTSIDIPNSVTDIGSSAFSSCSRLTSINISSSVTNIGSNAFYNCSNLNSIHVDSSNSNYSDDNGVLYQTTNNILLTYPMAKTDTSYSIRNNTTSIAQYAFYNCDNLTDINLNSSSLKTINYDAFYDCDSITSINIPVSVTSIGSQVFYDCDKLESINVDEANTSYTSNDEGVLFNYSKNKLVVYPQAKAADKYTIPETVLTIDNYAFSNAKNLVNIDVPNDITSIGSYAFSGCTNLKSIKIPVGVTNLNTYIVSGCNNLKEISIYNKNARISYGYNHENKFDYDYLFGWANSSIKANITIKGYVGSTAEEYAFLSGINFERLGEVTKGLLVDENGMLYGYEGTDTEIILSDNIKAIGPEAFKNPNNINDKTYENITSIDFPLGVRTFESYAFKGCKSLTSLDISRSVYEIKKNAFYGCENLAELNVSSSNTTYKSIGGKSGKGNGVLTDHAETIIKEVVNGYKGPNRDGKYVIPSDITGIEDSAFAGCNLKEVTLGNSVGTVGVGAFKGVFTDADSKINLADVGNIDNEAFADCTGLTEITIPNTLERMGDNAFAGCTNLKDIKVETGSSKFFVDEGTGVLYTNMNVESNSQTSKGFALITYPMGKTEDTYKILDDTVEIYKNAFSNCKNLKTIDIPNTVMIIGERAFEGCNVSGIKDSKPTEFKLEFKDGLEKIEAFAFAYNELLQEVIIPKSVESIASGAFTNCSRLYKVTIYNEKLEFGTEADIFDTDNSNLIIYGYVGSTAESYAKSKNIKFEPITKSKNKTNIKSVELNAVGNINATVDLTPSQSEAVIQSVYSGEANEVALNVNVSNSVYSVAVNMPKSFISSLNSIANSTDNKHIPFILTVNTSIANISLDKEAIAKINSNSASSDIRIVIRNVDISTLNISSDEKLKIGSKPIVEIEIISGNSLKDLGNGTATISIPYSNLDSNMKIVAISNSSCIEQLSDLDSTNTYLVFSVNNLNSKFAISEN